MNKISGYVCVRNAIELDYCVGESVLSLLPACDEVVVADGESTDGTTAMLLAMAAEHSKIRVINYPWPGPQRDIKWWVTFLNYTRERLRYPVQLTLDADEILCPLGIPTIRAAAEAGERRWFHRLNFWRDAQSIVPHGCVCGEQVVRLAPTQDFMCSDEPADPEKGEYEIRKQAGWPPNASPELRIFHLGFIREEKAFHRKVAVVNNLFFGSTDTRMAKAEREKTPWINEYPFDRPLIEYSGAHPEVAHEWLRARGYNPTP